MSHNVIGAFGAGGAHEIGAFEAEAITIPAGSTAGSLSGRAITSDGGWRVSLVTADSAEAAGDVYIAGIRHTSDGLMYATLDTPPGSDDQFINGLRVSSTGVLYIQNTATTYKWPEGQACDSNGVLAYLTEVGSVVGYVRGAGVDINGAVLLRT